MATTFNDYAAGAVAFDRTLTDFPLVLPHINVRQFQDSADSNTWKGATGLGADDDYTVFAAAVAEAVAGPKVLYVPAGSYKLGTKLDISDIQVICSSEARFVPGSLSMTMIEMKKNSFWYGGYFNARVTNFTGIMMLLDGSTNVLWAGYNEKAPVVSDVFMIGGIGVGGGGTGIKIYASGTSTKVTMPIFNNIKLTSFADGILIQNGSTSWISSVTVSNAVITACTRGINLVSSGTYNVQGCVFNNIVFQPDSATTHNIKITDADYNMFENIMNWDSNLCVTAALEIVSGLRNKYRGEGHVGYTIDTGTENDIDGAGGPLTVVGGIAGATVDRYNPVYVDSAGKYQNCDADAAATMPAVGLCATVGGAATAALNAKIRVIKKGRVYNATWNWGTLGAYVYVSTDPTTTNGLTLTIPSGSGDQVQILGIVESADSIIVDPQLILIEVA